MQIEEMKKSELLSEIEKLGKKVNPGKKREELVAILRELNEEGIASVPTATVDETATQSGYSTVAVEPKSDSQKIMDMLGTVVSKLDNVDKRLKKVETGDANAFQEAAMTEDVEKAQSLNQKVDKRIVAIVEKTLGIDFGVTMEGYSDKPGMLLTILVPKRLSPIADEFRPVMDEQTGAYKIDPTTKRVVEEQYWPGDRRSVAMGATDSFDVVQKHANRVRSFIMATYQKQNKPQPDFKVKVSQ